MVKAEEVERLTKELFPTCPICGADKGYDALGWFKYDVQCRECRAKWYNPDFENLKLEKMKLTEPARDGSGSSLINLEFSNSFWQSLSDEELKKSRKEWERIEEWKKIKGELAKGKIAPPYPKMICSDCKNVIEADLEELTTIVACTRCDSDNLKIAKDHFDEWYKKHWFVRLIFWIFLFPLTIIWHIISYLPLFLIIAGILIFLFLLIFGGLGK